MSEPPSAWQIERALSTWMAAREALIRQNPMLADDESAVADLMRVETADVDAILTALIRASIEADMMVTAIKTRQDELATRRGRWEKWRDDSKAAALMIHEIIGHPTLRQPDFTVSKGTSAGGVTITDVDLLPAEFVKVEKTPKKTEIGVALDAGRTVAGAQRSNGTVYLRIVRK